jgi:cytochrome b
MRNIAIDVCVREVTPMQHQREEIAVEEIAVWDPFVRVFHWLLATSVIIAWFTDEPLWLHTWLGYAAAGLIVLRVVWGFAGPEQARFSSFVRKPRVVLQYAFDLIRLTAKRYVGHSPAGGAMIVALLFMVAVTTITGMADLAAERGQGPLGGMVTQTVQSAGAGEPENGEHEESFLKELHETAANITMVLVILHLAGVGLASIAHRENLVRAMITGRKRPE